MPRFVSLANWLLFVCGVILLVAWLVLPARGQTYYAQPHYHGGQVIVGPVYEWRFFSDTDDQVALWRDGVQVGCWSYEGEHYRPYNGHTWGPKIKEAPITPPVRPAPSINHGVVVERLNGHEPHYSVNGQEVSREEALAAVGKGTVPDDSNKPAITVIGPAEARKKIEAELAAAKDKARVQSYDPASWAVSRFKFKTDGSPSTYIQTPDGKVISRTDGPDAGKAVAAMREPDPNYDPSKDPDLSKPSQPIAGCIQGHHIAASVLSLLACAGAVYKMRSTP